MRNISINEGGVTRNFTTAMLQTDLKEGGTCRWVNPNDIVLTSLYAMENGLYTIKNNEAYSEYYGFSNVTVHVPGENRRVVGYDSDLDKIVAVGPDSAGNMTISDMPAIISPDCIGPNGIPQFNQYGVITGTDLNGNPQAVVADNDGVHLTNLPTRIEVTTMPTNTQYSSGQNLNFSGMVVTAYYADGTVWGTVPIGQIVPSRRKAVVMEGDEGGKISDLGIIMKPGSYQEITEENDVTGHISGDFRYFADNWVYSYVEKDFDIGPMEPTSSLDIGQEQYIFLHYVPFKQVVYQYGGDDLVVETYDLIHYARAIKSNVTFQVDGELYGLEDGRYQAVSMGHAITTGPHRFENAQYYSYKNKAIEIDNSVNPDPFSTFIESAYDNLEIFVPSEAKKLRFYVNVSLQPINYRIRNERIEDYAMYSPGPSEILKISRMLWTIAYGLDAVLANITLYWQRPGDKEILSTQITLDIVV